MTIFPQSDTCNRPLDDNATTRYDQPVAHSKITCTVKERRTKLSSGLVQSTAFC